MAICGQPGCGKSTLLDMLTKKFLARFVPLGLKHLISIGVSFGDQSSIYECCSISNGLRERATEQDLFWEVAVRIILQYALSVDLSSDLDDLNLGLFVLCRHVFNEVQFKKLHDRFFKIIQAFPKIGSKITMQSCIEWVVADLIHDSALMEIRRSMDVPLRVPSTASPIAETGIVFLFDEVVNLQVFGRLIGGQSASSVFINAMSSIESELNAASHGIRVRSLHVFTYQDKPNTPWRLSPEGTNWIPVPRLSADEVSNLFEAYLTEYNRKLEIKSQPAVAEWRVALARACMGYAGGWPRYLLYLISFILSASLPVATGALIRNERSSSDFTRWLHDIVLRVSGSAVVDDRAIAMPLDLVYVVLNNAPVSLDGRVLGLDGTDCTYNELLGSGVICASGSPAPTDNVVLEIPQVILYCWANHHHSDHQLARLLVKHFESAWTPLGFEEATFHWLAIRYLVKQNQHEAPEPVPLLEWFGYDSRSASSCSSQFNTGVTVPLNLDLNIVDGRSCVDDAVIDSSSTVTSAGDGNIGDLRHFEMQLPVIFKGFNATSFTVYFPKSVKQAGFDSMVLYVVGGELVVLFIENKWAETLDSDLRSRKINEKYEACSEFHGAIGM